ncbi:MAG: hypothetical protein ABSD70_19950 [Terracidiphilus sp.]|jgi:hypothetical protein
MSTNTVAIENHTSHVKGRESRTQSIATRFTRAEEQSLLKRAEASNLNLREWARNVLLRAESTGRKTEIDMHIFTELVGLQMLLMDTLEPLLRGDKLAQEQVNTIFRKVQATKAAKAQELLAKRSQKQEK